MKSYIMNSSNNTQSLLDKINILSYTINNLIDIKSILNVNTKNIITNNEQILRNIAKRHRTVIIKPIRSFEVREIYKVFFEYAPAGIDILESKFDSKKKIRKLANSITFSEGQLCPIIDSEYFDLALALFDKKFSGIILNSLFLACLIKWNHHNSQKLMSFILAKKNNLKRTLRINQHIFDNSKYFLEKDSLINLVQDFDKKNLNLNEITEFIGLSKSSLYYEYFGGFIELFITTKIKNNNLTENLLSKIISFLDLHNNKKTYKKCIVKIVIYFNNKNISENSKMELINQCFKNVGDPNIDAYWTPWDDASIKDKEDIEIAKTLLNQWLTQKFIFIFFEKVSMDLSRKNFWSEYINCIENFRIYLVEEQEIKLRRENTNIIDRDIFDKKIGRLEKNNGDVSAFILKIKDFYIVEFSDIGGACYIYHDLNKNRPNLHIERYTIPKLKHSSNKSLAIDAHYNSSKEGRIIHSGDWEYRFRAWLRNYPKV